MMDLQKRQYVTLETLTFFLTEDEECGNSGITYVNEIFTRKVWNYDTECIYLHTVL